MARKARNARRKARQRPIGKIRLTRRGYGSVSTPEGDFFILPSRLNGAMDGDTVEVARLRTERRPPAQGQAQGGSARSGSQSAQSNQDGRDPLGAVVRVIERNHQTIIGQLIERDGLRVVRPIDERIPYDIFIDIRAVSKPAKDGDIVVVRLTTWPSRVESAGGFIEEVVGESSEAAIDIEIICRKHRIRTVFSADALEQASNLSFASGLSGNSRSFADGCSDLGIPDILHRRDLTDLLTFTIDPADARDFDDALSAEYLNGQLILGVHIADVSAYVQLDSALDIEARTRGTSVYLPDRVIPMLPEQLSNELCSLAAGVNRLSMSIMMTMNSDASVQEVQMFPSIICSKARLNYDQVDAFIGGAKPDTPTKTLISSEVGERLVVLDRLARKLKARRIARGAIDFESTEAKVNLDDEGRPIDVTLRTTTSATSLVEEAMILANEQVAQYMLADRSPMIYRVHEEPLPFALEEAANMLTELKMLKPQQSLSSSAAIHKVLEESIGRPEHRLISSVLLRAMKRARYSAHYTGHFGLASKAYCHFTSPIRRYPDLLVHHLLKLKLAGQTVAPALAANLQALSDQSSACEDAAEAATREATNLKLVEYMSSFVGQTFKVMIVSATELGLFITEDKTTVEGLIPKDNLPVSMFFEASGYRYTNASGSRSLAVGQIVSARLTETNISRGWLNFEPIW
ncbi:MAG: VacB/RNase II family 3'-5' exoribonuclease [Coriobacteriia bacterium]|nr:VacB/RNase II family 3'-5' exoribonuclease [Coriobacteriia bacterium]